MKCPYNITVQQRTVHKYEHDTDGRIASEEIVLVETHPFVDCLQQECGAWQNGRCCYNDIKDHW